jgi:hypothetical protein
MFRSEESNFMSKSESMNRLKFITSGLTAFAVVPFVKAMNQFKALSPAVSAPEQSADRPKDDQEYGVQRPSGQREILPIKCSGKIVPNTICLISTRQGESDLYADKDGFLFRDTCLTYVTMSDDHFNPPRRDVIASYLQLFMKEFSSFDLEDGEWTIVLGRNTEADTKSGPSTCERLAKSLEAHGAKTWHAEPRGNDVSIVFEKMPAHWNEETQALETQKILAAWNEVMAPKPGAV